MKFPIDRSDRILNKQNSIRYRAIRRFYSLHCTPLGISFALHSSTFLLLSFINISSLFSLCACSRVSLQLHGGGGYNNNTPTKYMACCYVRRRNAITINKTSRPTKTTTAEAREGERANESLHIVVVVVASTPLGGFVSPYCCVACVGPVSVVDVSISSLSLPPPPPPHVNNNILCT